MSSTPHDPFNDGLQPSSEPTTPGPTEPPTGASDDASRPVLEPSWADARGAESPLIVGSAPALHQPSWSGKKTAIAAALAIGLSSMGAIGAAAALPAGTGASSGGGGQFGPGGRGQLRGGLGQGQTGGMPGQQSQGGTSQLTPSQLNQLNQLGQSSGGQGSTGQGTTGQGTTGQGTTGQSGATPNGTTT